MAEKTGEELFEQFAVQSPIRGEEEDLDDNMPDSDRTLDDYERSSPNLTDLQFLIKTLSPDFKDEVYNALIMARLAPDTFRPFFKLLVNDEIRRQIRMGNQLSVVKTAAKIYTILTIALDGKHIVDVLEAFGSRASDTDLDALKGMNGGL